MGWVQHDPSKRGGMQHEEYRKAEETLKGFMLIFCQEMYDYEKLLAQIP